MPGTASPNGTLLVHGPRRRVVGGDGVDRAVLEGREQRDGVLRASAAAGRGACRVVRRRVRGAAPAQGAAAASHDQRRSPPGQPSWSARWCGVTSQVTRRPFGARRADRVERAAAERWARCRCGRTSGGDLRARPGAARATARETALTSAADGCAAQPQDGRRQPLVRLGARGQRWLVRDGPRRAARARPPRSAPRAASPDR